MYTPLIYISLNHNANIPTYISSRHMPDHQPTQTQSTTHTHTHTHTTNTKHAQWHTNANHTPQAHTIKLISTYGSTSHTYEWLHNQLQTLLHNRVQRPPNTHIQQSHTQTQAHKQAHNHTTKQRTTKHTTETNSKTQHNPRDLKCNQSLQGGPTLRSGAEALPEGGFRMGVGGRSPFLTPLVPGVAEPKLTPLLVIPHGSKHTINNQRTTNNFSKEQSKPTHRQRATSTTTAL